MKMAACGAYPDKMGDNVLTLLDCVRTDKCYNTYSIIWSMQSVIHQLLAYDHRNGIGLVGKHGTAWENIDRWSLTARALKTDIQFD